jgi:hypothetical protein
VLHQRVQQTSAKLSGFDDRCASLGSMRTLLALQSVATFGFLKMMPQVVTQLKLLLPNPSVEGVLTRQSVLSGEYRMRTLVYGVA